MKLALKLQEQSRRVSLRRDAGRVEAAERMLQLLRLLHYDRELNSGGGAAKDSQPALVVAEVAAANAHAAASARALRIDELNANIAQLRRQVRVQAA
mmetsp:Transcript_9983/g.24708  ORF Transcript_9983/g.24708 Transcript_9983/m.24708 type:complete len:97 (+) Transcript_9983:1-291(+)